MAFLLDNYLDGKEVIFSHHDVVESAGKIVIDNIPDWIPVPDFTFVFPGFFTLLTVGAKVAKAIHNAATTIPIVMKVTLEEMPPEPGLKTCESRPVLYLAPVGA